jgi:hypothetical protein
MIMFVLFVFKRWNGTSPDVTARASWKCEQGTSGYAILTKLNERVFEL